MRSPSRPSDPAQVDAIREAGQRLVRTVDSLGAAAWTSPSLLPGWTRAHLVAHLALNAEALTGILAGLRTLESVAMYTSRDSRSAAIDELAAEGGAACRERLLASTTRFQDALGSACLFDDDTWARPVPRTPGGATFGAYDVPAMRRRELEVHHVDLDAGYGYDDWPPDFSVALLDVVVADQSGHDAFAVTAEDLGRSWVVGGPMDPGGIPVVTGTAAGLGWWLSGRGEGEGLRPETGSLPRIGSWR